MRSFSKALFLALLVAMAAGAQTFRARQVASQVPSAGVSLKPGQQTVPVQIRIQRGFHINSVQPAEDYLIPTRLIWDATPLTPGEITFPEAETVTYEFSNEPLLVYSDTITITTEFAVPAQLPASLKEIKGELRYQACNSKACLAPAALPLSIPVRP